jgi:CubicO group peptidase (beta-lactamase class C family)
MVISNLYGLAIRKVAMKKRYIQNLMSDRISWFIGLLMGCLLVSCASPSSSVSTQAHAKDPIQAFMQEIERLQKKYTIPGMSVAVLKQQHVIFAEGFGYADIENKISATADTPYNIASLTKTFGAAILMKLVEDGQLDLEDEMAALLKDTRFQYDKRSIDGYEEACKEIKKASRDTSFEYAFLLKEYRCDTRRITVKHHLTHTAQGVPGDAYRYNGFLFGFLSLVAEEVSGKSFADLLVEDIIRPLNMTRTIPSIDNKIRQQVLADRAKYYKMGFGGDFVPSEYPVKLSSSAGMISTVLDLAKFDVAMDRNLIVSEATKALMFTPNISNRGKPLPYGLGWFVQNHKGKKLVWHYGHAPKAYSSLILKVPEEKVTLILLANSDGASAPFRLGAGNVLRSPFAVAFLNLFTDLKVTRK